MSELIRAENLAAGYSAPVVRDICLSVKKGEILTLIGPNGSGKSTVLKTLAGALKSRGGAVYLGNERMENVPAGERAKRLSIMLTGRADAELMTCREVVETGRYPYTGYFGALSKADRAAAERAIKAVDMEDFADADFSKISDGQRRRVMLAKAVCQEPETLILDEPTTYLDLHHKIAFLEIIRRLARGGMAVIMSMHELDFAAKISDSVICLKDGAVYRRGKPDEIFKDELIRGLFDISAELYKKYLQNNMTRRKRL